MNTLPKICIVTCLEFDDSQTLLFGRTIMRWGYPLIMICPGSVPGSLSGEVFQHCPLPDQTRHFDFNSSLSTVFIGLFQRFRNSIVSLYYLLNTKPDICICVQPDSWLVAVIAKIILHNHVIVDLREIYEDRSSAFLSGIQPLIRQLLRIVFKVLSSFTDEIIHVSKARQKHYSYLTKPGIVISPFPELENYTTCAISKNGAASVSIVHAGSLRWTYASDQFIESIPKILEKEQNIKFIVIGGVNPNVHTSQLIENLTFDGKLMIIPKVPHKEVIDILMESDIGISLVLPLDQTHILAMPRKFFEYMAAGLPIVAADVPTLRELIETEQCGVLVDPCSCDSIAEGILRLISDEHLRKEYGANARRSCENHYNWKSESNKLHDLLRSLM